MEDGYFLTQIELHVGPGLPRLRRCGDDSAGPPLPTWTQQFESPFINPAHAVERLGAFRWVGGHHHLFFCWKTTTHACGKVIRALEQDDVTNGAIWLKRVATLLLGSTAAMLNSSDFDSSVYLGLIRPSMDKCRNDFSAFSARDYAQMKDAIKRMECSLLEVRKRHRTLPEDFRQAEHDFRIAWDIWFDQHDGVARRLAPDLISMLDVVLRQMREERADFQPAEYVRHVVRSPEAMADYDRYFGVRRVEDMALEDFFEESLVILARIHRHAALPGIEAQRMREGDSLLLTVIAEELAKPGTA